MSILKDLISLNIFVFSLIVLYQTTNHHIALCSVIVIAACYIFKHFKLNNFLKKELKGQIQIFETLFNSSSDVIVYLDLEQQVIACNDALTEDFGIKKEDLIGHSLRKLIEVRNLDKNRINKLWNKLLSNIDKAIKTQKSVQMEDEYYSTNNELKAYSLTISPTFSSNRNVNGTTVVARNVSAEKSAVKEALEKRTQLMCILENMPICAYMKDVNDCFIVGSSSFEEIIQHDFSGVQQLHLSDIYDEDYLEVIKKEEAEVYKTKQIVDAERQVVLPNQTFWGRVRKVPVLDKNGNVKYLVVMYENIESEKEIERQKEYFIETLIHDLKIPTLAQLRGLELLKNGTIGNPNSEEKELITEIEDSCKCILDMISMVLNTYRIENGQNNLYYEKFSMADVLLSCFSEMSPNTQDKNLIFAYNATQENTNVEADKAEIRKVIINLLSNAITYSNKNEKIIVNISTENNQLKFTITSKGIILSERECLTMFERSAINSPKYSTIGHGIGLYLCKKIIDIHHGKIYASTDGKSTNTFTFIIPIHGKELTPKKASPLFI